MLPGSGDPDSRAFAKLDVKHFPAFHARVERSWFKMKVRRLEDDAACSLWIDDPSTPATDLVLVDSFIAKHSGNYNYAKDTKQGDTLFFGATLAGLSGMAVEVRDAAGTTVLLSGTIPPTNP